MAGFTGGPPDMFFGGVSTLAEHLDQTIMVVLRDGRHLLGALSSFDQYGSLVLESARERHFARGKYCDIAMGVYLVRGENIAICGVLDEALDASNPLLVAASWEEVQRLQQEEEEAAAPEAGKAGSAAAAAAPAAATGGASAASAASASAGPATGLSKSIWNME